MLLQLNPPLPVLTPKGKALAHFLIDEGPEHDLKWVCFQDDTGECWTYANPMVRAQKNITQGREHISPFYNPDDVAFKDFLSGHNERLEERKKINEVLSAGINSSFFEESPMQKHIKEAKRMSETPKFEDLAKSEPSIIDKSFQDKIAQVSAELRGNELKILDDFCKAYYAAESHMTGKDFMGIVNDVALNIQTFFKDGQMGTRYWFSAKEKENG